MIRDVLPGYQIRILSFCPSRIPHPGVKKAPDPKHCLRVKGFLFANLGHGLRQSEFPFLLNIKKLMKINFY
jgi:hypothetical protein